MMELDYPQWFHDWAASQPWAYTISACVILAVAVWISQLITQQVLLRGVSRLLSQTELGSDPGVGIRVIVHRLAQVVPALVLSAGIYLVPDLPETVTTVIRNISIAYLILTLARSFSAAMTSVNEIYNLQPDAHEKPIKGYLQIAKIVVYVVAAILIIASLLDRSPVILLSGIGAMGAVAMLVFQDTILSLVASIQLSSNDMIRVGDWIEMPQLNADGDVIDIALHTVRVQNWDKTITNIPTKRLISESFKNWRGMQESGGRRIKRALYIDQNSIHFLSDEQKKKLKRFSLLNDYLEQKEKDISEWNSSLEQTGADPINGRQVTNIGTFRAYVKQYLSNRPDVHKGLTLMVRQLNPGPQGLPIEIYCFSNDTAWETYEGIQSDIFDHLFAILPQFDLQVFQETSGQDVRTAVQQLGLTQNKPE
ncbi:mechanosensitive ion channel family protein [Idiomarina sp. ST10R2A5]|uniref:mechanosensitive ion channel family protein n=1 Tax=Idiomarina sp. ST10R2A5 TaxID=3418368 RepID=UPI003EC8A60E